MGRDAKTAVLRLGFPRNGGCPVRKSKVTACAIAAFIFHPRKEVIQPQVPLRLPCYDFTPVANPTVVGCLLLRG